MMRRILLLFVAFGLLVLFSGCQSMGVSVGAGTSGSSGGGGVVVSKPVPHPRSDSGPGHGPPDHAPAHGRRAKYRNHYRYHYYVNIDTYFDLDRKVYFYRRSGEWIISISLPSKVKIATNEVYVEIELNTARPYEQHDEVIKKHPATKKKNKNKKGV